MAIANTAQTFRQHSMHYNDEWMPLTELSGDRYAADICLIYGGGSQFRKFEKLVVDVNEVKKRP